MSLLSYMYISSCNPLVRDIFPLLKERKKKYREFIFEYWERTYKTLLPEIDSLEDEDLSEMAFKLYKDFQKENCIL